MAESPAPIVFCAKYAWPLSRDGSQYFACMLSQIDSLYACNLSAVLFNICAQHWLSHSVLCILCAGLSSYSPYHITHHVSSAACIHNRFQPFIMMKQAKLYSCSGSMETNARCLHNYTRFPVFLLICTYPAAFAPSARRLISRAPHNRTASNSFAEDVAQPRLLNSDCILGRAAQVRCEI